VPFPQAGGAPTHPLPQGHQADRIRILKVLVNASLLKGIAARDHEAFRRTAATALSRIGHVSS